MMKFAVMEQSGYSKAVVLKNRIPTLRSLMSIY
jgi:hypothetical protein